MIFKCSIFFEASQASQECGSCGQIVHGECTNALGKTWHVSCFVCQYCKKAFADGSFFEHDGMEEKYLNYITNFVLRSSILQTSLSCKHWFNLWWL